MTPPDLAVVDVETTGFAYKSHDRIVEVAVVRTDFWGEELATFESLVDPRRDVGPTHIHGITAGMVTDAPPFEALADAVLEVLEGTCWVAHNARFDVSFLKAELERAGARIEAVPHHCTLRSTRAVFPDLPSHRLERICEALDIELEAAHSALSDARATRDLLDLLRGERPDLIPASGDPFRPGRRARASTAEPLTRRQVERALEGRPSPMRGLLSRLPSVETDHQGEAAYTNLLDDVLLDRILTDRELEAIESLAREYGISASVAEEIHLDYLGNLIRYALLDGVVVESEREDIARVQGLLGLEHRDLDALIEEVREGLDGTYGEDRAAMDPELEGKSVCFTGSLTARIDGETVTRKVAQRLADERGMVIKKGVTKKLDYLVAADPHTQSNKAEKARRYDVPIVAEMEFWRRLGVEVG